jgi:hypothetical protein
MELADACSLLPGSSPLFCSTRSRRQPLQTPTKVETEQIVDAGVDWATGQPLWSSVVQVRGGGARAAARL